MKFAHRAVVCVCLSLGAEASATSLKDAPVVFKSGNWSVLRVTDNMTDKASCVGIYKDDYGIQLSPGVLYIHTQGGPQGYQYRFDDEPASGLRLATDIQRRIDSIEVGGSDFGRLIRANRLRYSVSTVLGKQVEGDLELTGIGAAAENVANCPPAGQSQSAAPASTPPFKSPQTQVPTECSDSVRARLKDKGMSEADVDAICGH